MNFHVRLDAAVVVRNVVNTKDAVSVAVAEVGRKLNKAKLNFVEIEAKPEQRVIADTSLVGLELSLVVFDAESEEHAIRIAKSVIGKALPEIPLKLIAIVISDEKSPASQRQPKEP